MNRYRPTGDQGQGRRSAFQVPDHDARTATASVLDSLGAGRERADRVVSTRSSHGFAKPDRVRLREIEDGSVSRFRQPLPELLLDALLLDVVHLIIIPPLVRTAQTRRSGQPDA